MGWGIFVLHSNEKLSDANAAAAGGGGGGGGGGGVGCCIYGHLHWK